MWHYGMRQVIDDYNDDNLMHAILWFILNVKLMIYGTETKQQGVKI